MVKLLKVHGSQNHFFILDQTELDKPLTDEELRDFTKKNYQCSNWYFKWCRRRLSY